MEVISAFVATVVALILGVDEGVGIGKVCRVGLGPFRSEQQVPGFELSAECFAANQDSRNNVTTFRRAGVPSPEQCCRRSTPA